MAIACILHLMIKSKCLHQSNRLFLHTHDLQQINKLIKNDVYMYVFDVATQGLVLHFTKLMICNKFKALRIQHVKVFYSIKFAAYKHANQNNANIYNCTHKLASFSCNVLITHIIYIGWIRYQGKKTMHHMHHSWLLWRMM
jgi:hypothetical protein